jgi:hypothetical protein
MCLWTLSFPLYVPTPWTCAWFSVALSSFFLLSWNAAVAFCCKIQTRIAGVLRSLCSGLSREFLYSFPATIVAAPDRESLRFQPSQCSGGLALYTGRQTNCTGLGSTPFRQVVTGSTRACSRAWFTALSGTGRTESGTSRQDNLSHFGKSPKRAPK